MRKYQTEIKSPLDLKSSELRTIAGLYLDYYAGTDRTRFLGDLWKKREVLLVKHNDRIVGFSTLQIYPYQWRGESIRVVYSGDTVVEREHWGQQALAFRWVQRITEIKQECPDMPLYWFVIIKGHRTYKYLPAFGKSFYPHWSIDRSDLKPLADYLAVDLFGDDYNPATGIIEFDRSHGYLKMEIAEPSKEELQKPSVRFFLEKNPNYRIGHELVCLCELEQANMKSFTRRLAKKNQCNELVEPA